MNILMRWTLFFAVLMLVMKPGHAANSQFMTLVWVEVSDSTANSAASEVAVL